MKQVNRIKQTLTKINCPQKPTLKVASIVPPGYSRYYLGKPATNRIGDGAISSMNEILEKLVLTRPRSSLPSIDRYVLAKGCKCSSGLQMEFIFG
jgi:hypothetical protein